MEDLHRPGLPPREHSADAPESADSPFMWIAGVITVFVLIGLVLFGTIGRENNASNANLNTEPGVTTGAAPTSPSKPGR
jgi:hypothetical protein